MYIHIIKKQNILTQLSEKAVKDESQLRANRMVQSDILINQFIAIHDRSVIENGICPEGYVISTYLGVLVFQTRRKRRIKDHFRVGANSRCIGSLSRETKTCHYHAKLCNGYIACIDQVKIKCDLASYRTRGYLKCDQGRCYPRNLMILARVAKKENGYKDNPESRYTSGHSDS